MTLQNVVILSRKRTRDDAPHMIRRVTRLEKYPPINWEKSNNTSQFMDLPHDDEIKGCYCAFVIPPVPAPLNLRHVVPAQESLEL